MSYFFKLFFFVFFFNNLNAEVSVHDFKKYKVVAEKLKLKEVVKGLNHPWGLTFIDEENLIVTEKNGGLLKININSKKVTKIKHKINSIPFDGSDQGGLLDVLYDNGFLYFSYSHQFENTKTSKKLYSTAISRGKLIDNEIKNLELLLLGKPKLSKNIHWGSRIVINKNLLYAGFGERGLGMIAQDPSKHPGSIIRINIDGSIPKDNPHHTNKPNWLPEIYQIGVRNPQGMAISPKNKKILGFVKITNKPWRKYFFLKLFTFFISKLIFDINESIPRKIKYTAPINLTNSIIWSSAGEIKLKPRAKSRINIKTPN